MDSQRTAPSRMDVRDRMASLLAEIAKIPPDSIVESATIDGELRMESVDFVELQVALEDEYLIEIDPIRVVELNRFGDIVDYVHGCATGNGA
jgi:acyl carrier protein